MSAVCMGASFLLRGEIGALPILVGAHANLCTISMVQRIRWRGYTGPHELRLPRAEVAMALQTADKSIRFSVRPRRANNGRHVHVSSNCNF